MLLPGRLRTDTRRRRVVLGSLLGGATSALAVVTTGVAGFGAPTAPVAATRLHAAPTTTAPPTTVPAPTTTAPPAPTTTAPPAATTTAPPPPPPAAPAPQAPAPAAAPRRGILPPSEPPANIAPSPNFLNSCSGSGYDDSAGCVSTVLAAIANARASEGLPAMTLPGNWDQLSPAEQLYVATNLERTVRGLPALGAMASALDQSAAEGAAQDTDPSPPQGFPASQWGANWAGAVGNPLEAVYFWMYDDGPGSSNIDCTAAGQSGCWGHRQNVLLELSCQTCVMGTGFEPTAYQGDPSWGELLVDSAGQPAVDFTWAEEQPYL
jgi:hypothetical protein